MDDRVCEGCGTPLSEDENYACEDCANWWLMNGLSLKVENEDE